MKLDRVLSGTRPTGKLHLGNLLGALENYKKLQGAESFFMIADWHALTTEYESHTSIADNVTEVVVVEAAPLFIFTEPVGGVVSAMQTPLAHKGSNPQLLPVFHSKHPSPFQSLHVCEKAPEHRFWPAKEHSFAHFP